MSDIKVLALDLDGTLTNDQKLVTPRTRAALDAAIEKGVTIVLASGRPTAGIQPLAEELGLDKKGGCILSYNGGKIVDCRTGETLVEKTLDPALVPELCAFAAAQDIAILTYNREGIVCERDKDEWANKECFTTKLPMIHVDDLASYVNYPVCKMLITLDPARRDAVCAAGQQQFAGRADLYPSSPFFIEAVPLGVAKDGSLAELLRRMAFFFIIFAFACDCKHLHRLFYDETLNFIRPLRQKGIFMGFLSGLFHSRDKPTNSTNGSAYCFLFGGSNSGKAVNERSAMQ